MDHIYLASLQLRAFFLPGPQTHRIFINHPARDLHHGDKVINESSKQAPCSPNNDRAREDRIQGNAITQTLCFLRENEAKVLSHTYSSGAQSS